MLFSVNYKSAYKQEADEIRCPINQLGLIFPFMKDNPDKRYNIADVSSIERSKAIEQIEIVKEITNNYTIECGDIATFRSLIFNGYNAYLRFPVTDWETFDNLVKQGASDIYIDGPLGFQSSAIIKAKQNNPVKIRVSPTVSSNAVLGTSKTASSFFIRPEDLSEYKNVIDIIDFKVPEQEKEDTLYKIYKRGTFDFNLADLIEHLNMKVPNLFIQKEFVEHRLNCGQRCKMPGKTCHLCDTQISLTNTLLNYFERNN